MQDESELRAQFEELDQKYKRLKEQNAKLLDETMQLKMEKDILASKFADME